MKNTLHRDLAARFKYGISGLFRICAGMQLCSTSQPFWPDLILIPPGFDPNGEAGVQLLCQATPAKPVSFVCTPCTQPSLVTTRALCEHTGGVWSAPWRMNPVKELSCPRSGPGAFGREFCGPGYPEGGPAVEGQGWVLNPQNQDSAEHTAYVNNNPFKEVIFQSYDYQEFLSEMDAKCYQIYFQNS